MPAQCPRVTIAELQGALNTLHTARSRPTRQRHQSPSHSYSRRQVMKPKHNLAVSPNGGIWHLRNRCRWHQPPEKDSQCFAEVWHLQLPISNNFFVVATGTSRMHVG